MEVIDARLDDRPFRSVCQRIAADVGATRWVLLWPDGHDRWLRIGAAAPRDVVLAAAIGVAPRHGDLETTTLGDPGARLAALGIDRVGLVALDRTSSAVLVLEEPAVEVEAEHPCPDWFAVALDQAARHGPSLALAEWVEELPAIAGGHRPFDEALGRFADLFDLTGVAVACPARRGVRILTWCRPEPLADPLATEDVRFDADWAAVVAVPDTLLFELPPRREPARRTDVAVAQDRQLVLAVEGPHALADVGARLAADLFAQALANHSVRVVTDDRTRLAERTRLATALHEELSQRLAALTVQIDVLSSRFDAQGVLEAFGGLRTGVVDALESLRSAIYELTPPEPDWSQLDTGLERFVNDHAASRGLEVTYAVDGEPRPIDPDLVSMIFACVQEGLTNVAKHAGVDEAAVSVRFGPDAVTIVVADEGDGILGGAGDAVDRGHQGLGVLRTRARLVGASLTVDGEPGAGTTLTLRVPTAPADDADER